MDNVYDTNIPKNNTDPSFVQLHNTKVTLMKDFLTILENIEQYDKPGLKEEILVACLDQYIDLHLSKKQIKGKIV